MAQTVSGEEDHLSAEVSVVRIYTLITLIVCVVTLLTGCHAPIVLMLYNLKMQPELF